MQIFWDEYAQCLLIPKGMTLTGRVSIDKTVAQTLCFVWISDDGKPRQGVRKSVQGRKSRSVTCQRIREKQHRPRPAMTALTYFRNANNATLAKKRA